jgi:hypothetical protein
MAAATPTAVPMRSRARPCSNPSRKRCIANGTIIIAVNSERSPRRRMSTLGYGAATKAVAPTIPATSPKRERTRANVVRNPNTSAATTTQPSARSGSTHHGTRLAR